jgi:subtilisin family serine protease
MKLALLLVAVSFHAVFALVPLMSMENSGTIKGQYLIVFHKNTEQTHRDLHLFNLHKSIKGDKTQGLVSTFNIGDLHGFAARLSDEMLAEQRQHDDMIEYIEADQEVHVAACSSQSSAEWGLDRVGETSINLDGIYRYDSNAGSGVDAYIVDTGILITHTDFGGRAKWGANYADSTNSDCNGHGTHVAGTVGGTVYGIAKKVNLIAVKVLNCQGSGTNAGVISGIEYVLNQYKSTRRPSVANMSLGGSKSTTLNNAVASAIAGGVTFVVAAGNENQDACNTSPASTSTCVSVGATTIDSVNGADKDVRASFSNYGTCVTIMAPGELIKSAWIGSNTATKTISGTSMASPHTCGVAALYLANNPSASPATIKSFLSSSSLSGVVNMMCSGGTCTSTPNKFLHHACA